MHARNTATTPPTAAARALSARSGSRSGRASTPSRGRRPSPHKAALLPPPPPSLDLSSPQPPSPKLNALPPAPPPIKRSVSSSGGGNSTKRPKTRQTSLHQFVANEPAAVVGTSSTSAVRNTTSRSLGSSSNSRSRSEQKPRSPVPVLTVDLDGTSDSEPLSEELLNMLAEVPAVVVVEPCPVCGLALQFLATAAAEQHLASCLAAATVGSVSDSTRNSRESSRTNRSRGQLKRDVSMRVERWVKPRSSSDISSGDRAAAASPREKTLECIICLEDFEDGQAVARLDCLCFFHNACIDKWFQRKRHCPLHAPN
ncbi:hypothetical protein DFJ73DRAFT_832787 [Zopfochytrium polystomum]|nr:hypothetical protein DFJ73DRAFT_832787 [Zopfochytrium polystomum]